MPEYYYTGIEKLIKTYTEGSSFSNQKNLEETEELRDEVIEGKCAKMLPKTCALCGGKK